MPPEWSQQAFALSNGEISQVFQVGGDFYIVENIEGPKYEVIPFSDASPPVATVAALYYQRQQFMEWLTARILREPLVVQDTNLVQPIADAMAALRSDPGQLG